VRLCVFFGYFEPDGLPVAWVLLHTPSGGEALKEHYAARAVFVSSSRSGWPRVLVADPRVDPVPEQGNRDVNIPRACRTALVTTSESSRTTV
jgi:hypothetical protein